LLPGDFVYLDEIQKIYVERVGSGPPLLMVPGMTGDAGELLELRDQLCSHFATVTIDRRGYSRSPRGWTKSSCDEQARDLARLMDALGLEWAYVFAASVGAAAVVKLLMRYPGRV